MLLFSPALRSALTSGYAASIEEVHRWSGRGQVVLAVLVVVIWSRLVVAPEYVQVRSGAWGAWRLTHVILVSAIALGLAASGIVLSSRGSFSLSLVDYSFATHLWLTYVACGVVITHAFLALAYPHSRQFFALERPGGESDDDSTTIEKRTT